MRTFLLLSLFATVLCGQQPNSAQATLTTEYFDNGVITHSAPCLTSPATPECLLVPTSATNAGCSGNTSITGAYLEVWASVGVPSIGDYVTETGQSVDLDIANSSVLFQHQLGTGSGSFGASFPNQASGFSITIQMIVLDNSAPDGFWMSGAVFNAFQ